MDSSSAGAQAPVQVADAEQAYLDARFEEARATAHRVLQRADLSRRELAGALVLVAMASFALRDEEKTREALRQLAVVDDEFALPSSAPPPVADQWELVRGTPIAFDPPVDVLRRGARVIVSAAPRGDFEGLRRRWRVRARIRGDADWVTGRATDAEEPRVALRHPEAGEFEVEVQALGPGGVVLRRAVRAVSVVAEVLPDTGPGASGAPPDDGDRRQVRVLVAVGVLLAAALGVGVGVRLSRLDDGTRTVEGPYFE